MICAMATDFGKVLTMNFSILTYLSLCGWKILDYLTLRFMSKILCIGSVAQDVFFPTSEGEFFETPEDVTSKKKVAFEVGAKYQIEDRYEALGGVAANTAVGFARLGLDVECAGGIGDDALGQWILQKFAREGVSVRHVQTFSETQSDLSLILVFEGSGDRTIFYNRDAAEKFLVNAIDFTSFSEGDWVSVSALNGDWKGNLEAIISRVQTQQLLFALNPGQRNIHDDAKAVLRAAERADVFILNKDEAIELALHLPNFPPSKIDDELSLIRALHIGESRKVTALTDGMRGAWVFDGTILFHAEAIAETPVETTGAGDAFSSGFLSAFILGKPINESLQWGVANAGASVLQYGAIAGLLRADEIAMRANRVRVEEVVNEK